MFTIRYPPTSTRDLSESRTTTTDPLGYGCCGTMDCVTAMNRGWQKLQPWWKGHRRTDERWGSCVTATGAASACKAPRACYPWQIVLCFLGFAGRIKRAIDSLLIWAWTRTCSSHRQLQPVGMLQQMVGDQFKLQIVVRLTSRWFIDAWKSWIFLECLPFLVIANIVLITSGSSNLPI